MIDGGLLGFGRLSGTLVEAYWAVDVWVLLYPDSVPIPAIKCPGGGDEVHTAGARRRRRRELPAGSSGRRRHPASGIRRRGRFGAATRTYLLLLLLHLPTNESLYRRAGRQADRQAEQRQTNSDTQTVTYCDRLRDHLSANLLP